MEVERKDNQDVLFSHGGGVRCLTGGNDFHALVSITVTAEEPECRHAEQAPVHTPSDVEEARAEVEIRTGKFAVVTTSGDPEQTIELSPGAWNVHVTVSGHAQNATRRAETDIHIGGEERDFTLWPKNP